jgi:hypothetical protein
MTSLSDSNTAEYVTSEELDITYEQYEELVQESLDCRQEEGHVHTPNGRSVYAA